MAARAMIALSLAALAWVGSARAEDDPSCAQYREPMAYNLCLARHGPKANNVGQHSRRPQPAAFRRIGFGTDMAAERRATRFYGMQGAQRMHGRMHMEFPVR